MPTINLMVSKDAYVRARIPDWNSTSNIYPDNRGLSVGLEGSEGNMSLQRAWFGFDLTSLAGATINWAYACFPYYGFRGYDYVTLGMYSDLTWREDTITWNNAPDSSLITNVSSYNSNTQSGRMDVDISFMLYDAVIAGGISFRIDDDSGGGFCRFDTHRNEDMTPAFLMIDYEPAYIPTVNKTDFYILRRRR
jgi:hypothetical protein